MPLDTRTWNVRVYHSATWALRPFDLRASKKTLERKTRLEVATSCVTDRVILYNYQFIRKLCWKIVGCSSSKHMLFYLSINLANYLLITSKKSIFTLHFRYDFQRLYRKIVLVWFIRNFYPLDSECHAVFRPIFFTPVISPFRQSPTTWRGVISHNKTA